MVEDIKEEELEAKIDLLSAEIKEFKVKAQKRESSSRARLFEEIDRLKIKEASARGKLPEFKAAGSGAAEDLQTGIKTAWGELSKAVENARKQFR